MYVDVGTSVKVGTNRHSLEKVGTSVKVSASRYIGARLLHHLDFFDFPYYIMNEADSKIRQNEARF